MTQAIVAGLSFVGRGSFPGQYVCDFDSQWQWDRVFLGVPQFSHVIIMQPLVAVERVVE